MPKLHEQNASRYVTVLSVGFTGLYFSVLSSIALFLLVFSSFSSLDSEASEAQYSSSLWDVDYHHGGMKLVACRVLCMLAVVMAVAAVLFMAGQHQVSQTVLRFKLLLAHALASLLTCEF